VQESGPSNMGVVAKKVSDTLSGKVDTESASYKLENAFALTVASRKKQLKKELCVHKTHNEPISTRDQVKTKYKSNF
jgi:hypothetical protein